MTKLVVGRGVQTEYALNVLWTIGASVYPGAGTPLNINHFVPMISISTTTSTQVSQSVSRSVGQSGGGGGVLHT